MQNVRWHVARAWDACHALDPVRLRDTLFLGALRDTVRKYAHPRTQATLLHVIANACVTTAKKKSWTAEVDRNAAACVAQIGPLTGPLQLAGTLSTPLHVFCTLGDYSWYAGFDRRAVNTVFALREAGVDPDARDACLLTATCKWLYAHWALNPVYESYLKAWQAEHATCASPCVPAFKAMCDALGHRFTSTDATAALRWALQNSKTVEEVEIKALVRLTAEMGAELESDSFALAAEFATPETVSLLHELYPAAVVPSIALERALEMNNEAMVQALVDAGGVVPSEVPRKAQAFVLRKLDEALLAQKPPV